MFKRFDKNTLVKALVFTAIAVGIFFRFYQLGLQELWYDELFSTVAALEPSLQELYANWLNGDGNPQGFYVLLWLWLKVFPATEAYVRLPSAIAGALTLVVFFAWGKKFLSKPAIAIGTILFSFSYGAIYYAQEARGYSLLMLLATVATLACLELFRHFNYKKRFVRYLIVYFAFVLLMSYIHYFGALYGGMLTCCLFLQAFRTQRNYIPLLVGICIWFVGFLPALPNLLLWMGMDHAQWPLYGLDVVLSFFKHLLFTNSPVSKGITIIVLLLFLVTAIYNMHHLIKERKFREVLRLENHVPEFLFSLGLLMLILFPLFIKGLDYRHLLVFYPLFFLVAGKVIAGFPYVKNTSAKVVFIASLSVVALGFQMKNYYGVHKQQWGTSARHVLENYKTGSAVIILGVEPQQDPVEYLRRGMIYEFFYMRNPDFYAYYLDRLNTGGQTIRTFVLRPDKAAFKQFVQQQPKNEITELFILGGHHLVLDDDTKTYLAQAASDSLQKTFYSTQLYWYKLPGE